MTKGAGRRFPIAMQSMNTLCGIHAPRITASTWTKGIAVYAPPKERLPATRPRRKRCGRSGTFAMPSARDSGDGSPLKWQYIPNAMYWAAKRSPAGIQRRRDINTLSKPYRNRDMKLMQSGICINNNDVRSVPTCLCEERCLWP